jgi:hypothetical protein
VISATRSSGIRLIAADRDVRDNTPRSAHFAIVMAAATSTKALTIALALGAHSFAAMIKLSHPFRGPERCSHRPSIAPPTPATSLLLFIGVQAWRARARRSIHRLRHHGLSSSITEISDGYRGSGMPGMSDAVRKPMTTIDPGLVRDWCGSAAPARLLRAASTRTTSPAAATSGMTGTSSMLAENSNSNASGRRIAVSATATTGPRILVLFLILLQEASAWPEDRTMTSSITRNGSLRRFAGSAMRSGVREAERAERRLASVLGAEPTERYHPTLPFAGEDFSLFLHEPRRFIPEVGPP